MEAEKQTKKRSSIWIYVFILVVVFITYQIFFANSDDTNNNSTQEVVDGMKSHIVYVTYEFSGKNSDGSYFEKSVSGSGVIFYVNTSIMQVFTNRHVIDCGYTSNCYQRFNETVKIRTQDSKIYEVSKVMLAPHGLDIAVLEIKTSNAMQYPSILVRKSEIQQGEEVTAIGYPALPGINNVLEFTISKGTITNFRDFMTSDGFSFKGIDSDAYTNHGSSGGGLFDTEGNLVGINTWIQGQAEKSIAININVIDDFSNYYVCEKGSYPVGNNNCLKYCARDEVLGSDNACYKPCKDFYCQSREFDVSDPRCKDGLIPGEDGYCHQPCETASTYCVGNGYCYKNRCVQCPQVNTYLFEDGNCRVIE